MQQAIDFIMCKVPVISTNYRTDTRHDRQGKVYFTLTFEDIAMPADISTGFKRMYHFAEITPTSAGFSVRLSLKWETLQGGTNGVTIFNEYVE